MQSTARLRAGGLALPGLLALLLVVGGGIGALLVLWPAQDGAGTSTRSGPAAPAQDPEISGPHPEPFDSFHPERDRAVTPAYGGSVTVHIESKPRMLNSALDNSQMARNVLNELHAWLVRRDWESWELEPELCTTWEQEDTLVLKKGGPLLFGKVTEEEYEYVLARSDETLPKFEIDGSSPTTLPSFTMSTSFPKDDVERIERGTVITFYLRRDVRWHDGHPFDASDVLFSWSIAANPLVSCDTFRPYLQKIERAEVLDSHTIRFFFREQYFNVLNVFADNLCILPAHLFDLRDPDHPRHDREASDEACAREINENPRNTEWVGLGPYRLTSFSQQGIEAERFGPFFDPEHSGYFDRIRWRHIPNDDAAFQALLEGEVDFTLRISSEQYFGPATQQDAFTRRNYKGYFYLGAFNYVPWNLRRPLFQDLRVRQALAHALDLESFVQNVAHGLAKMPTGSQCYFSPAYNHDVRRLEYDLQRAEELLAEAGWYDRDGDGTVDKDGVPFHFEMLSQAGNKSAELFAQLFQEGLSKIGVRMEIVPLEWATYYDRIKKRDFDCGQMSWSVDVTENDPIQLWHTTSADKGGNYPGVSDPRVDELIARGARELDDGARWATWRELHRYLYEELQPYLYREMPARKFAMNRAIRGFQAFKINPGFSVRRWFHAAGTAGTRATREQ